MKYVKPEVVNVADAHAQIMGVIKGVQAPDNDSSSQLATTSAYEADE